MVIAVVQIEIWAIYKFSSDYSEFKFFAVLRIEPISIILSLSLTTKPQPCPHHHHHQLLALFTNRSWCGAWRPYVVPRFETRLTVCKTIALTPVLSLLLHPSYFNVLLCSCSHLLNWTSLRQNIVLVPYLMVLRTSFSLCITPTFLTVLGDFEVSRNEQESAVCKANS